MLKVTLEFDSLYAALEWAKRVAENPTAELMGETKKKMEPADDEEAPKTKKKSESKAKDEPKESVKSEGKEPALKLIDQLKEAGVKLTDMNPSRYEGVQTVLAKYGVTKIKDLDFDDQPEVLKMWEKMADASKEKYNQMIEFLKEETKD